MKALCVFLVAIIATVYGKTFTKCSLAQELVSDGVSRGEVHHWVCLAQAESGMSTTASNVNTDGTADHGIFRINDYWSCRPSNGKVSKNACGHPCSDFEDSYLTDDVACVKQIMIWRPRDFTGYSYAYRTHCNGTTASYLSGCFY